MIEPPRAARPMRRLALLPNRVLALAGVGLGAALIAFSMSSVGAGEVVIEIHASAEASFEGFPDQPLFVAIVGTDDRPGVSGARADAVHLVGVNPMERRATLIDIPRDTWVDIPGVGTRKINESHSRGGAELVGQTLTAFTGAPVQYVVTTNFAGFTDLVDEMGGVDVEVPIPVFDSASGANFDPGARRMSGAQALAFSRARKTLPQGDITRTHHQGLLLLGALAQVQASAPNQAGTMQFAATLSRHLRTTAGVGIADLYRLGRLALQIPPENVQQVTMPARTGSAGGASVVFATEEAGPLFADFADDALLNGSAG